MKRMQDAETFNSEVSLFQLNGDCDVDFIIVGGRGGAV